MESVEVMSKQQLGAQIAEELPEHLAHFATVVVNGPVTSSQEAAAWLDWCGRHRSVRVTPWEVPRAVLPQGRSITLHDVKVDGHGPDDKLYNNNPDIRDKVARGNTVLEVHDTISHTVQHDMAIFALRKFTGGMGDEDEDQPEDDLVWQRYFLKPMSEVSKVVCMIKENGEAAHVSVRLIDDKFYFIAGSKNVHLLFKNAQDLELYTESRFMIAKKVGAAWLQQLEQVPATKTAMLLSFLHASRLTMIFEILCPDYQHVVDLSHLPQPQLKFLTFTKQYNDNVDAKTSLSAFSPDICIEFARYFSLDTANYDVITAEETEKRMMKVRQGVDYEGEVLYFMDNNDNTIGLLKKKTTWYIVLRAIREKVSHAHSTYKKNPGGWSSQVNTQLLGKLNKRLDDIQRWLSLTPEETHEWKMIGRSFQSWLMEKLVTARGDIDKYSVRGNFPQLWRQFLNSREGAEQVSTAGNSELDKSQAENILEEPRSSSPRIIFGEDGCPHRPHIGAFILRNVDLMGKNFKKVMNVLNKTHGKICNNKKKAYIGIHDIERLNSQTLAYKSCSPTSLLECFGEEMSTIIKENILSMEHCTVLYDGNVPLAIPPFYTNDESGPTETSENILVQITSEESLEAVVMVMNALMQQFYHLGIKMNCVKKCVHVEKVALIKSDNVSGALPENLPELKK